MTELLSGVAAGPGADQVHDLRAALARAEACRVTAARWGRELADRLPAGARLLAAGNGGSAAQAQHLTAELVGRFCDERPPFSALCLSCETSTLTALANDYGAPELFARQVAAHARPGDVLVLMSTSGRSENLLRAAAVGAGVGATVWAMTGRSGNPLAAVADDALCVDAGRASTVQEMHLLAVHILCGAFDAAVGGIAAPWSRSRT